jgi:hypothetical protein
MEGSSFQTAKIDCKYNYCGEGIERLSYYYLQVFQFQLGRGDT